LIARGVGVALLTLLGACDASAPPGRRGLSEPARERALVAPSAEAPAAAPTVSERHFGSVAKLPGEPLPVERVMADPEPYLGQSVKCSGTVARVCQAAGCWLELQPTGGGEGLRVPMANHAFFIPKDAVDQLATVEGELKRQPLPDAQREHYKGEGMQAMGPLSLEATSVVLR